MSNHPFKALLAGLLLCTSLGLAQAADTPSTGRVYEIRTYYTFPGRLEALHKRFREHTLRFFEKHGMKNVAYWVPQDAPARDNTLVYVLTHESRAAAKASWDAFRADPEWKKVAAASEADGGKIVERVESVYLDATDYSPMK
jgi:hypothetical protein